MKIINLGMGKQSTALYLLSSRGDIPRADHAIFADTTHESSGTYEFIQNHLMPWAAANNGIPIHVVRSKNGTLLDALRHPSKGQKIPAFVKSADGKIGQLKRTCTHVYKIIPIQAKIRELMGMGARGKFPAFEQWFGINAHEFERALKMPNIAACTFVYPLLGLWSRRGAPILGAPDLFGGGGRLRNSSGKLLPLRYAVAHGKMEWRANYPDEVLPGLYAEFGLPTPPHSSCVFCPFQSSARWAQTFANPADWAVALEADDALKSQQGMLRGEAFLLKSGKRLLDADLVPAETSLQFFDGCEGGYCGV